MGNNTISFIIGREAPNVARWLPRNVLYRGLQRSQTEPNRNHNHGGGRTVSLCNIMDYV